MPQMLVLLTNQCFTSAWWTKQQ